MRGSITREYVVRCYTCFKEVASSAHRQKYAIREFRSAGWSKTVKYGWVCRRCKTTAKAAEETRA